MNKSVRPKAYNDNRVYNRITMSKKFILIFMVCLFSLGLLTMTLVVYIFSNPENYTAVFLSIQEKNPEVNHPQKVEFNGLKFSCPGNWKVEKIEQAEEEIQKSLAIHTPGSSHFTVTCINLGEKADLQKEEAVEFLDTYLADTMNNTIDGQQTYECKNNGGKTEITHWGKLDGYGRIFKIQYDNDSPGSIPTRTRFTKTAFITKNHGSLILIQELVLDQTRDITAKGFNLIKSTIKVDNQKNKISQNQVSNQRGLSQ